jgi:hypothetical protein
MVSCTAMRSGVTTMFKASEAPAVQMMTSAARQVWEPNLLGSKDWVNAGEWYSTYCMFGQGKIIRFSIAPGDLQSKGLRTAFQMKKKIAPEDSMLKC